MRKITHDDLLALLGGALAFALANAASATNFLQVYHQALQHDPAYRQAHATYMAAREARPEAFALLLPQISAAAGENWDHSAGRNGQINSSSNHSLFSSQLPYAENTTGKSWSVNLSANLFSWTDWMNLKAADHQVAAAQANYEAATQGLILTTAQAYFNVLAALDSLHAQQSSLKALTLETAQARKEYKIGMIAITDVQQARAARDAAAAEVIVNEQALSAAEDQLQVITGRQYRALAEPGPRLPLALPHPARRHAWVQAALRQNLSLIATRLGADAARDGVRAAYGSDIPTVSLYASRSYTDNATSETVFGQLFHGLGGANNDRQIGIELSLPIFSGGGDEARIHQAEYQSIAANDAVQVASRSTVQQTRNAYLGVVTGIADVRALSQALISSKAAYVATEDGYKVGRETEVDVLNALSTFVSAQTNYATSRYGYIDSLVQLQYAAGMLYPAEVRTINSWLTRVVPLAQGDRTGAAMTAPMD
jgi:outer membrane protein